MDLKQAPYFQVFIKLSFVCQTCHTLFAVSVFIILMSIKIVAIYNISVNLVPFDVFLAEL